MGRMGLSAPRRSLFALLSTIVDLRESVSTDSLFQVSATCPNASLSPWQAPS